MAAEEGVRDRPGLPQRPTARTEPLERSNSGDPVLTARTSRCRHWTKPLFSRPDKSYKLEASEVTSEGGDLSSARNDIAKPEVAHAFWRAIISTLH